MGNATVGYECVACGWVYDPAVGDPDSGIAPGTRWEDIPDDWVCPVCGAGKDAFERQERAAVAADDRPPATPPIVIVGAGLAGYTLARELRTRSAALPVLVIAADGGEVYTKPMLSNAFAKKHTPDDLVQRRPEELAAELGITIRTRTRVTAIDRAKRRVTLDSGETVTYDQLVLAVGADPRVFPAEGSDAVGIATVNDLDSYRAWRARIAEGRRILLIGAGLIGCEFANDLAGAGYSVDVIDPSPWPLARLLPKEIGLQLAGALGSIGATVHLGRSVARYRAEGKGFVAVLDDGQEIAFDHALSAVGLRPRTALAAEAGLTVKAGIVVDRYLRTDDPAIFALGDCAESPAGPLPFIAPLLAEARVLAATLTVEPTPLVLPALPVVVKTPVLPLVVCPPPMGSDGAWEVKLGARGGEAVFRAADGTDIGFALSGTEARRQAEFTTGLPDTLPPVSGGPAKAAGGSWTCDVCGYAYDPNTGDPDNGVLPGTAWDDVPDGWECPVCGAGRDSFSKG